MAKNYLIVGGGSGIGKVIAERLAAEGNQVWAFSRSIEESERRLGIISRNFDVLNDEGLPDIGEVIDGLVYCPGSIQLKPFERISLDAFRADLEINYLGAIKVLQQALPLLKKSDSASVVLFSTVAVQNGLPFHSSISGAKGAVEGLCRSLAAEYAPKIRFNAIAPSLTDTPLAQALLSNDRKREANADRHPLKRVGQPEDMAEMALFLLSEKSSWISGQVLKVDGGMSAIR
ncbi:SDR family NAD(P)-dependent oxidoreductase [Croceimicrobium hydrocarbonivorans]|uniref:SDR family oxidoreductase n=1 Tax=Croceimicrobium hydrocarbonivorans TaxID=2761580 RepID=A0A7H0VFG3_9FLAO|nr:SDR family oxidoreductase [Croceimicrobium hydrocarbonivorans]QNR24461.1 SDR family oxidoreductase [Croceimicrobium hydrocarbonivorans]